MTKSTEILEALKMQPLTEEEKASRHILGRWYGPIATCNESTRNGRRYNRELWEKALNDELFHEKIANKCLFLELGHPQDREETDMSKVCACIPEMPKIINGDLCACVDILDTPNGRILKTLCDYGFVPGVSSRGSGDVMPNNDVDPETFYLETFDCVAIPAVKRARGIMCESLDRDAINLKKALTESINKASEEDKAIMKETLENLDIDIEASEETKEELVEKRLSVDEIPWDPEENLDVLTEDTEDEEETSEEVEGVEATEEAEEPESGEVEAIEEVPEEVSEEPEEPEEVIVDVDSAEEATLNTVADAIEQLQEYDDDTEVQFEPIEIDGKEYNIDKLETFVDEEDNILVVGVNCEEAEETSDDTDSNIEAQTEDEEISVDEAKNFKINASETLKETLSPSWEEIIKNLKKDGYSVTGVDTENSYIELEKNGKEYLCKYKEDSKDHFIASDPTLKEKELAYRGKESMTETSNNLDSAVDDGDIEVIESLKEMIRQKEALETEIGDLRKAKSVGDAKEKELQEKLNRYRAAFRTTSAEAAKVPELQSKVKELTEQLTQAQNNVKTLTEKVNKAQQLKESIEGNKANERRLNEEVSKLTKKSEALEAKLEGQTKQYTTKLQERTDLAKKYKARFIETLTKYVESKASMLGVKPSEITSRLNESYTLADVDAVCNEILDSTAPFGRLPFSGRTKASVRITESISKKIADYDDDDLSSLYELAGLKK